MEKQSNPLRSLDPDYNYTVKELAHLWNVSGETVRRMFDEEPGVLVFQTRLRQRGKRAYRTLRIPGWVALRVENRARVA